MRMQRFAIALTAVNLVLLVLLLVSARVRFASAPTAAEVLRGRVLELVNERGVVRVRLGVKQPGTVVELDLFDRNGINHVKLGAGDGGSGLLLTDEVTGASSSYVQIIARRTGTPQTPKTTSITLRASDGRERVIAPP